MPVQKRHKANYRGIYYIKVVSPATGKPEKIYYITYRKSGNNIYIRNGWIPKYRKKALYGDLRRYLGEVLRELARRRECEILEGNLMGDHAHMLISIPLNMYLR